jgi:hypothetical protein
MKFRTEAEMIKALLSMASQVAMGRKVMLHAPLFILYGDSLLERTVARENALTAQCCSQAR